MESHRREVRDAILESAATLVAERGLLSVTRSEIAQNAGIGRATLYKYFRDVEAILLAWHDRQIEAHLAHLEDLRYGLALPFKRLEAVLEGYALISTRRHGHQDAALAEFLHRDSHVEHARRKLREMIGDLLAASVETGDVRADVPPAELASYCLHALGAARDATSKTALRRLLAVTLGGLRPPK